MLLIIYDPDIPPAYPPPLPQPSVLIKQTFAKHTLMSEWAHAPHFFLEPLIATPW